MEVVLSYFFVRLQWCVNALRHFSTDNHLWLDDDSFAATILTFFAAFVVKVTLIRLLAILERDADEHLKPGNIIKNLG